MKRNGKLQNALDDILRITKINSILFSPAGVVLAGTMEAEESFTVIACDFADSVAEIQYAGGLQWYRIDVDGTTEAVLAMKITEDFEQMLGEMATCQIRILLENEAEQYDRNNFIQNILLGNMLTVDIFGRAKKLHIEPAARAVFVIDTGKKNNDIVFELVKNLAEMKSKDFVTCVDQHSVVLVKDVASIPEEQRDKELVAIASRLVDNLHMEAMVKVRVGYGNIVHQITEIAQSFQEAKMAIEVGKVFYAEYDTISYSKLGIGRLIYQLPMSLCEMYIKEVFGDEIPDILEDEEAMSTINKFFENSLNISETARQLYVHRNTLVYRLERIEKAIGLDIRTFDDALIFRIAMMVIAHMKAQKDKGV